MGIVAIIGKSRADKLFSERIFPPCSIISTKNAELISCPSAAVILGNYSDCDIVSCAALIADADAPETFARPSGKHIAVITCGRSGKNTVSITSLTEERITLSLNRSLQTLNGICEPLEQSFPLIEDVSVYDYMAAFAACIVLGKIT